jgi:hypothetical protein
MDATRVPLALQERLGPEATAGLVRLFEMAHVQWTSEIMTASVERFERRLVEEIASVRVEVARGEGRVREEIGTLRQEMAVGRFELLKWSFIFGVGQVVAIVGLIGVMLRSVTPTG